MLDAVQHGELAGQLATSWALLTRVHPELGHITVVCKKNKETAVSGFRLFETVPVRIRNKNKPEAVPGQLQCEVHPSCLFEWGGGSYSSSVTEVL